MSDAAIRLRLAELISCDVLADEARSIAGGCINRCFRYQTKKGAVFVKVADKERLDVFQAEAAALEDLRATQTVRVPSVLGVSTAEDEALLVLEWIDLHSSAPGADAILGRQLAALHQVKKPLYGWKRSNFIGTTPQPNLWSRDWLHFWRTHRLDVQLNLAVEHGADALFMERAALLSALMDGFFTSYIPEPSCLHGDLWSGNYAADATGVPVLFDPATYFGDRECDLAMTRLFGGFSPSFYAAYVAAWPLDPGWQSRVELYNLYHVLNHFNLFGGGYLTQAQQMVNRLLADLGH